MKELVALGKYFQQKRIKQGLSQKDVSIKLGYTTPQFISNWERGVSMPPISVITQLSKMYKVNSEDIFNKILEISLRQTKDSLIREFNKYKSKSINHKP